MMIFDLVEFNLSKCLTNLQGKEQKLESAKKLWMGRKKLVLTMVDERECTKMQKHIVHACA